jgi:scyllo-inositol 2-dehydrogenase (NADP+)
MSIRTAIVGYGFSAKTFHLPFITTLPEFEFCAVSSSQTETLKQDWPGINAYTSATEMIEGSDADLVIITAPNDVHFSLAKEALAHDKHVLLEKPFVTNTSDGETLIELAAQRNRVLSVYQNRRLDGDFLTVRKLIDEKRLGNVRYFESHFDRFRPEVRQRWRETAQDGGGLLFDLGPHLLDQALVLFGKPDSIHAHCRPLREGSSLNDFVHLTLGYADKVVVLHASLFSAGPNIRFQVQGDLGSYVKYGLDPQEDQLRAGQLPTQENWGDENKTEYGTLYRADRSEIIATERGGYQRFFKQLAIAIRDGEQPMVAAEEALLTISLIELAIESALTGAAVAVP